MVTLVWVAVALSAVGLYLLCITGQFRLDSSDIYLILCALTFSGHILVVDYFMNRSKYAADAAEPKGVNWAAIIGVVAGAVVGNLTGGNIIPGFTWGIAAVNNMVVSFACYYVGRLINKK